jgi:hypothetical protein
MEIDLQGGGRVGGTFGLLALGVSSSFLGVAGLISLEASNRPGRDAGARWARVGGYVQQSPIPLSSYQDSILQRQILRLFGIPGGLPSSQFMGSLGFYGTPKDSEAGLKG